MRWLSIAGGATGVFLISLTPSHVTATDSKILAGASCWMNVQHAEDFAEGAPSWPTNRIAGRLQNASGESRYVYCPLVRDSVTIQDINDLEVNVDPSSTGQTVCAGYAFDRYGESLQTTGNQFSVGTEPQPLDLGILLTYTSGYAYVRCTLPDGHKIISIDVEEDT